MLVPEVNKASQLRQQMTTVLHSGRKNGDEKAKKFRNLLIQYLHYLTQARGTRNETTRSGINSVHQGRVYGGGQQLQRGDP